jgi:NAD(P)-dependent dehydrogenase (short-subunit alcohol dehydrogenase family)
VLAPFALIAWTRDLLTSGAGGRVITVGSGGLYAQRLPTGDFQSDGDGYAPAKLYARTKREQLAVSHLWADELAGTGVSVDVMHPGWVDTAGLRRSMPRFSAATRWIARSPAEGADTIVWLAGSPEDSRIGACLWHDRRPRPTGRLRGGADGTTLDRRRLWEYCASLVGAVGPVGS